LIKNNFLKFIFIIIFILIILLIKREDLDKIFVYFLLVVLILYINRIKFNKIFKKILSIIPFALVFSLSLLLIGRNSILSISFFNLLEISMNYNLVNFISILLKSIISILLLVFLIETSDIASLIINFKFLKFPKVLLSTTLLIYRYFYTLIDEIKRMEIARDLRYFGGYLLRQIKVFSNIIGVLLIRSIERSERVYYAMKLRGYDGDLKIIQAENFELKDFINFFILLSIILIIGIYL
jgi:cobalt/nickel transport system permease protein